MKHYYCPECGGLDYTPHECRTEDCALKGHELVECDCDNPESHKKPSTDQHTDSHGSQHHTSEV